MSFAPLFGLLWSVLHPTSIIFDEFCNHLWSFLRPFAIMPPRRPPSLPNGSSSTVHNGIYTGRSSERDEQKRCQLIMQKKKKGFLLPSVLNKSSNMWHDKTWFDTFWSFLSVYLLTRPKTLFIVFNLSQFLAMRNLIYVKQTKKKYKFLIFLRNFTTVTNIIKIITPKLIIIE